MTYGEPKNFDTLSKFNVIQNFNVTSVKLISYMGTPMLVEEKREQGSYVFSYLFNAGDVSVNISLTFTSAEADVHTEIFRSLEIKDAGGTDA